MFKLIPGVIYNAKSSEDNEEFQFMFINKDIIDTDECYYVLLNPEDYEHIEDLKKDILSMSGYQISMGGIHDLDENLDEDVVMWFDIPEYNKQNKQNVLYTSIGYEIEIVEP